MKNYDLEGLNQKRLDAIKDKYVLLEKNAAHVASI